ncbi:hypothetical protein TNCT_473461, partial [Trichonephila clavata]
ETKLRTDKGGLVLLLQLTKERHQC